jgi:signal peptidase I
VPDLPEHSRTPREGPDPRPDGNEVVPERRALDTRLGAPGLMTEGGGNGNGQSLGHPGDLATDDDAFDGLDADDEPGDDEGEGSADEPPASGGRFGRRGRRGGWRSILEWGLVIGGALLVALIVRTFLIQAFWIPSASMEPTLQEGDRVLVNKLSYDLHDVHRFDVIVFTRPDEPSAVPHPEDEIPDLIKRVIGLPGDTIEARDGVVYINDEPIKEPYLAPDTPTNDLPRQTVPKGHVFVMGDNRTNSHDSRRFGAIKESSIVGRAFVRIYPLDDIGGL